MKQRVIAFALLIATAFILAGALPSSAKKVTTIPTTNQTPPPTMPQFGTVTGNISILPGTGGPTGNGSNIKVTISKGGQVIKTVQCSGGFPVHYEASGLPTNTPLVVDFTYNGGWSAGSYPIKSHAWVNPVTLAPGQTLNLDMQMSGHPAY